MATNHFALKYGKTGYAKMHAEYILREGRYAWSRKAEELVYKESGNLPQWAKEDPLHFWNTADNYERINGRAYYEFEIALPNELSYEQNIKLVQEIVQKHIGPDKAYTFAIHDKHASLEPWNKNVHAHIMFCERINDNRPEQKFFLRYNDRYPRRGGARKDDRFTGRQGKGAVTITSLRHDVANLVNSHLTLNGFPDVKVDYRSIREQKAAAQLANDTAAYEKLQNKVREEHLGPKLTSSYKKAIQKLSESEKEFYFLEVADDKTRQTFIAKTVKSLEAELAALGQEYARLEKLGKDIAEFNITAQKELEKADYFASYADAASVTAIYDKKIDETQHIINSNLELNKQLQKTIQTKEQLKAKAIDIYTNNAYSQSLERLKHIHSIGQKWANRYQAFKAAPIPPADDIAANIAYTAELEQLHKDDLILQECEATEKQQLNKINTLLKEPKAKAAVNELLAGLEKNNDVLKERLNVCKRSIAQGYQLRKDLIKAKAMSKIIYEIRHELAQLGIYAAASKAVYTENALSVGQLWLNLDGTALTTPESLKQFNDLLTVQQHKILDQNKQYGEEKLQLMKKLVRSDKIDSLAVSMATSFQSTHIKRQEAKLNKAQNAYQKELSEFEAMKKPGLLDFSYRHQYDSKKQRLQRREQLLKERAKRFNGYKNHFEAELAKPETITKIQEFQQSIITKNTILESRISAINEALQMNKDLVHDIINYKQKAYSYYYANKPNAISAPPKMQTAMNEMSNAVYNAREAHVERGMLGRMHLDDEDRRYKDNSLEL